MRSWLDSFSVDLRAFFLSIALFELAANIVYVMLMEKAYDLGRGPTSVGVFLIIQAGAQIIFGSIIGSFADKIGSGRAVFIGLVAQAMLVISLTRTSSIGVVYFLALLITVARLFVITSRMPLTTHLSERTEYVTMNTAISVLTGIGLFLGPSIGALIYLLGNDLTLPFIVAAGLFFLAANPVALRASKGSWLTSIQPMGVLEELRISWRHIAKNKPIREVLMCLSISTMTFGAIMPMLTPLARHESFGSEGSGIFVAALGLGWMLGPLSVRPLIRRMNLTYALLITGLLTPAAAFAIGLIPSVPGILAALTVSAFAGASLNVIVTTILQRLTPIDKQGCVFGAQQTFSGFVWVLSVALITGVLTVLPPQTDPRGIFYPIGVIGALLVLACWWPVRLNLQRMLRDEGSQRRRGRESWSSKRSTVVIKSSMRATETFSGNGKGSVEW
jgi:MFS family permease